MAQTFAANVDPRESDLSRIDPDTLPSQFSHNLETAPDQLPTAALAQPRQEWFRWFLMALGVLLLVETVFAWRLGRGE